MADLDSLLDNVLDEFSDEERAGNEEDQNSIEANASPENGGGKVDDESQRTENELRNMLQSLSTNIPDFEKMMNVLNESEKNPQNYNESLDAALKMISEQSGEIKGGDQDEDGELLDKLLEEFQDLNPNDPSSVDSMVEQMMAEMMSKETLLPPIKQICDLYPGWFASHRSEFTSDKIAVFEKQYDAFKRTLKLLEADSPQSGSTEIMSILTEAQGYGNPPKEILAQLMPGMEFDADGNPIVPGIPGFEGASLGEPGADACTIM